VLSWFLGRGRDERRSCDRSRLDQIGDRLGRLRQPEAGWAMAASPRRYGQISPVVIFIHARRWTGSNGGPRSAKRVALLALNHADSRPCELEEAWIVFASLVPEQVAFPQETR
jgi:hypothetical protein